VQIDVDQNAVRHSMSGNVCVKYVLRKGNAGVLLCRTTQRVKMTKRKLIFAVICIMMLLMAAGCGDRYTSDEKCVWCESTPTKAIKSQLNGETVTNYYCEECVTTCLMCGEKATEQYTNESGIDMFLCSDCAAELTAE
jgi:hypothetical protein